MTRLSKVDSFKSMDEFKTALKSAIVEKKKFGGFTVRLIPVKGEDKIIHLSRNQLAKLALKLAESGEFDLETFTKVKKKLRERDLEGVGAGRGTKIKQAIGNRLFKMRHGANRAEWLESKTNGLKKTMRLDAGHEELRKIGKKLES